MKKVLLAILSMLSFVFIGIGLSACSEENPVIKKEVICGNLIVTYLDGSTEADNGLYPELGHQWNVGEITTHATCTTAGIMTYTCENCGAVKTISIDADGESHVFHEHRCDSVQHWLSCTLCGEKEGVSNHVFADWTNLFQVKNELNGTIIGTVEKSACTCGYTLLRAAPASWYRFVSWGNGDTKETIALHTEAEVNAITAEFEIEALDLPIIEINTQNLQAITSKNVYVKCAVSVSNTAEDYCFEGQSGKIRGRGNSTWDMPKKPYKLKFDSKIDLFGNGSAKTWTLIANYSDPSLARNYLAYTIGAELEYIKDTTTKVQFVDLYLNGSYDGVYLVCEQNEVGKTRVNIEDNFKKAPNPEDMGYLIELDARAASEGIEGLNYFVLDDLNYVIKSPEYDSISDYDFEIDYDRYFNYIEDYFNTTWTTICSFDYNEIQKVIDVNSFADSYIVHELFHMSDVGYASFYLYKKENGKLYSGPIWDFDISSGNCNYIWDCEVTNTLWAKKSNHWYGKLLQCEEFCELVSQRLKEYYGTIQNALNRSIFYLYLSSESFERNFERWNTLGQYVWPNTDEIVAIETWWGQVEYLYDWLMKSLNYLVSVYCID